MSKLRRNKERWKNLENKENLKGFRLIKIPNLKMIKAARIRIMRNRHQIVKAKKIRRQMINLIKNQKISRVLQSTNLLCKEVQAFGNK